MLSTFTAKNFEGPLAIIRDTGKLILASILFVCLLLSYIQHKTIVTVGLGHCFFSLSAQQMKKRTCIWTRSKCPLFLNHFCFKILNTVLRLSVTRVFVHAFLKSSFPQDFDIFLFDHAVTTEVIPCIKSY